MAFTSLTYAAFIAISFAVYWIIPQKYRWIVLLAASYYYYLSWGVQYSVWIILTTVISYFCAVAIKKYSSKKKLFAALPIIFSLGTLVFFKYFNFFSTAVTGILKAVSLPVSDLTLNLIMPVGISFYSFQTVGYIVDVYKGKTEPERHFGKYALFISFFPQVLSGPIARANSLLPQLDKGVERFDYEKASYGIRQIAWGLFKKMVVSAVCACVVDPVFNGLSGKKGFVLVIATVTYAFQIYCDFSGYTDIAIGSAKLFGIDLMDNFKNPYTSQSIKEFWSRWHISLSTWFRDYLYFPLGGSRVNKFRASLNVIIVFLVSGLWHGAAWTFIIWGLIHGVLQVIEKLIYDIKPFRKFCPWKKEKKFLSPGGIITLILTFAIICFTWIFFRANSIGDAVYVIKHLFSGICSPAKYIISGIKALDLQNDTIIRLVISLPVLIVSDFLFVKWDLFKKIGEIKPVFRWIIYIAVLLMIFSLTPSGSNSEFIYFQF